jgi:prepilin signal peptidase PulO-like enzyme (type II secretory pathway)
MLDILCNLLGGAFLLPLGMALGSFFEVVLDRVPRGESLLWPPSHCRICSHRLTPDELVPVVSYLVQHGRCRNCDTPIGRGVPIREALSGIALGLPWLVTGCQHPGLSLGVGVALVAAVWIVRGFTQGPLTKSSKSSN